MVRVLIISANMAIFSNKDYDFINFVLDVTNKTSSGESNYILVVLIWPNLGGSSIFIRQVIMTSIL